jgi:peptidyl-prolyl cis-trans isomerase B (cyclophilin B)
VTSLLAAATSLLLQAADPPAPPKPAPAPSQAGKQARTDLDALKASIKSLMDLRDQQQALVAKARAGTDDEELLKKLTQEHQELQRRFLELREKTVKGMDEFVARLGKDLEVAPADPDLLDVRAEALLVYQRPAEALKDLEALAKLRPEDADLALRLGRLQHSQNRYEPAALNLGRFLKKEPASIEARMLLALCDYALQNFEASGSALAALLKEEKLEPDQRQRLTQFRTMSDAAAPLWKLELAIREKEQKAGDLPHAVIVTSRGEVEVELFEDQAPNTVANFVELASKKFYDGLKFHRVIPGFMAQGGCPKGDGSGDAGYRFKDELQEGRRGHFRGSLSMANSGPDTNGSQFFITHLPTEWLNGKHTVFGRVVRGQEVVDSIQAGDLIVKAEVTRRRPHEYAVKRIVSENDLPELKPEKK